MVTSLSGKQTELEELQVKVKRSRLFVAAAFLVLVSIIGVFIGVSLHNWISGNRPTPSVDDLQKPRRTTPAISTPSETIEDHKGDQVRKKVCDTEDCHYMRWLIDASVDKSLDPCSNFFTYVCNGAVSNPNGQRNYSVLTSNTLMVIRDINLWLMSGHTQPRNQSAFQKVIAMYQSCINTSDHAAEANRRYIEDFLKGHHMALTEVVDFDPMTQELEFWFTDWPLIYTISPYPRRSINEVYVQVMIDWKFAKQTIQGNSSAERKSFVGTVLKTVFSVSDIDEATVNSVLEAEDEILTLNDTSDMVELIIPVPHLGVIENDEELAKRWIYAIEKYLPGDISKIKLITTVGAAKLFHELFGSHARIANETLQTAIAWMLTYSLYDASGLENYKDDSNATGRRCLHGILSIFPNVAGAAVLLATVNRSRVDAVKAIVEEISNDVEVSFRNSKWLDNDTKKRALEKMSLIIKVIGYYYGMMSSQEYDSFLRHVPDLGAVYIQNAVDAFRGKAKRYWESYGEMNSVSLAIQQRTMTMPLLVAYAINFVELNVIFVPAAALLRPMFTYGGPPELNYGGVGRVITHEMMHSFDVIGINYDGYGDMKPWFTNQSLEAFENLQACHPDQVDHAPRARAYHQYPQENLADIMASESLLRAYKRAAKNSKVTLGNVKDLTSDQLFYISWCLMWCGVPTEESDRTRPALDERCNVPLMNSDHFSEVFSCRANAPMNPSKKCHFW